MAGAAVGVGVDDGVPYTLNCRHIVLPRGELARHVEGGRVLVGVLDGVAVDVVAERGEHDGRAVLVERAQVQRERAAATIDRLPGSGKVAVDQHAGGRERQRS